MRYFLAFIFFAISFLDSGYTVEPLKKTPDKKIKIYSTIQPLVFFIESVAGDKAEVKSMLRPGDNPHTYEPLPSQLMDLSKTDLYIKLGSGIEFENIWMGKIIKINRKMKIINACDSVKLLKSGELHSHHDHGSHNKDHHSNEEHNHKDETGDGGETFFDPHTWLSVSNAIRIVENVKNALCEYDSTNKKFYRTNAQKLIGRLKLLKSEIENNLKNLQNRNFLIFHPSFGYFADEFNLIQIPVELEGKEPGSEQLKKIIDTARKEKIKIIFASPAFNTESAELISKEIDGKVILIDPLAKDYIKNLKSISETLKSIGR
ncbi:MAG TPA: zinc ABC transporter substrate-binding protein [bacterium]|nr:zinc ABC transporter substrate-binding protein [bacterium]HPN29653.1 zinc ABC transporter substrate-binding protein [bacterium]